MDRNSTIGFLLIGLTLIVFFFLTKPKPDASKNQKPAKNEQAQQQVAKKDTSVVTLKPDTIAVLKVNNDSIQKIDSNKYPASFAHLTSGKEEFITIENDLIKIKVSTKGGRISYAELKKYKTFDKKPLILFDGNESAFSYEFSYDNKIINSGDLYYTADSKPVYVKDKDSASVIMKMMLNDSQYVIHKYTVFGNDYMVKSSIRLVGFDKIISSGTPYIDLKWNLKTRFLERKLSKRNERITGASTTVFYEYVDESPDKLSETKDTKIDLPGKIKWVGFKQQFFTSVLIADNEFIRGMAETRTLEEENSSKYLGTTLSFPFDKSLKDQSYNLRFYFGPNHYQTLKKYHLNLERQIFLGRNILRWINVGIIIPVFNFLSRYIGNYGIIILLLTVFIKIILLPLTYKSYLSTARMKILKPDIDLIKAKVGSDMTKLQAEQMKLYRSAGVSPMGGCLPMLLQMPILIAMFRFFPSSIELRQQSFLWAHDLSTYDSIFDFPNGFKIPGYGDHISLFTLLMTISTIIYTKMNSDTMGGTGDMQKQMKVLQYVMPIMFLGFFNNYSAGLSYYYFLANILTFGQQYLFKLFINEDKLRHQIELNKQKKSGKPKSKWQQRLEEMQKQQRKR